MSDDDLEAITSDLQCLKQGQATILQLLRSRVASAIRDERDGPVPPDKCRLHGQTYGDLTRYEWLVLQALWGKDAVDMQRMLDHVYGHDEDHKDVALRSLIKRLNRKLQKVKFPGRVVARNGSYVLKFHKQSGGDPQLVVAG